MNLNYFPNNFPKIYTHSKYFPKINILNMLDVSLCMCHRPSQGWGPRPNHCK